MKKLLLEVERLLRWIGELTDRERTERAMEISEACEVFAEALEDAADRLDEDEDEDP